MRLSTHPPEKRAQAKWLGETTTLNCAEIAARVDATPSTAGLHPLRAGRVRHVGAHPALEDEMCDFSPTGLSSGRSPDRLDALVWTLTHLMLGPAPRLRTL